MKIYPNNISVNVGYVYLNLINNLLYYVDKIDYVEGVIYFYCGPNIKHIQDKHNLTERILDKFYNQLKRNEFIYKCKLNLTY